MRSVSFDFSEQLSVYILIQFESTIGRNNDVYPAVFIKVTRGNAATKKERIEITNVILLEGRKL